MKEVTTKMDVERLGKENSTDLLQFSVRNDVVVAYRSITDQYANRLAVVGVQWRMPYANALFMNWTRSSKRWSDCKKVSRHDRKDILLTRESLRNDPQFYSVLTYSIIHLYSYFHYLLNGLSTYTGATQMDCLLVTRSGFVLASSTSRSPGPLARFDPQLFASLEENDLVST